MNQKMMKKLEAIMDSYGEKDDDDSAMLNQTAFAISDGKGTWTKDGKPFKVMWHNLDGATRRTNNAIFYCDNEGDGLVGIKRLKNGKLYAFNDADFQCQITDPELIAIIETLAGISTAAKPKPKAKKAGKKFRVWFQVMGRYTDSNNIGYAIIEAKDKEQAIAFAREELTKGMFKKVKINCRGRNEDFDLDEDEQDEDEPLFSYDVNWEAVGKHGKYYAQGSPYAKDEKEAVQFQREDITLKNGFMGFETELEVEEEH